MGYSRMDKYSSSRPEKSKSSSKLDSGRGEKRPRADYDDKYSKDDRVPSRNNSKEKNGINSHSEKDRKSKKYDNGYDRDYQRYDSKSEKRDKSDKYDRNEKSS